MLPSQQEFKGTRFALLFAIMKHIRTCRTSRACVLSIKGLFDVEKPILFLLSWCEQKWLEDFFQLRKLPATQWILVFWALFKLRMVVTKMNFIVQVGLYAQHIQTQRQKFSDIIKEKCLSWSYDVAIGSQARTIIMVQDLICFLFLFYFRNFSTPSSQNIRASELNRQHIHERTI